MSYMRVYSHNKVLFDFVKSIKWFVTCKSVDLGRIVCQEMGFEKLISIKPTSNVNDLKLDLYMPVMNQPFDCSSKDGFILDGST